MVDESNIEIDDDSSVDDVIETEKFDVIYSCLRCNTKVSSSELSRLPEIKCICGFRVFCQFCMNVFSSDDHAFLTYFGNFRDIPYSHTVNP